MSFVKALFLASRPKTLIAGLCPVLIGATFSFYFSGSMSFYYFSLILLASVMIQIATNFFNDALDDESGRDTDIRKGPDRMAASGAITSQNLKILASGFLFISFLIGILLFLKAGWLVFAVGVPALFLAYLYTGTSLSLSANGIADGFVVLYFGVIPVWMTCFILSGIHSIEAVISGLQCGLLCNALLLINNLRDEEEDSQTGKNTMVVKYGRGVGLLALFFCFFAPYILNLYSLNSIFFRSGFWSFMSLPLAFYIFIKVYREEPSPKYNRYLGMTALHLIVFTVFYCTGVLSS